MPAEMVGAALARLARTTRSAGQDDDLVAFAQTDDAGTDRIDDAVGVLRGLDGADDVTPGRRGVTISASHGAALVGDVAVALSRADIEVASLTVRTPSLDDVFLQATGYRMAFAEGEDADPGDAAEVGEGAS